MSEHSSSILPLNILDSCPLNFLKQIYEILESNPQAKYDIDKLIERFLYTAPEVQDFVFFHGYSHNGIVYILQKYCAEKNEKNIKIHDMYTKFINAYKSNKGFINTTNPYN